MQVTVIVDEHLASWQLHSQILALAQARDTVHNRLSVSLVITQGTTIFASFSACNQSQVSYSDAYPILNALLQLFD